MRHVHKDHHRSTDCSRCVCVCASCENKAEEKERNRVGFGHPREFALLIEEVDDAHRLLDEVQHILTHINNHQNQFYHER